MSAGGWTPTGGVLMRAGTEVAAGVTPASEALGDNRGGIGEACRTSPTGNGSAGPRSDGAGSDVGSGDCTSAESVVRWGAMVGADGSVGGEGLGGEARKGIGSTSVRATT